MYQKKNKNQITQVRATPTSSACLPAVLIDEFSIGKNVNSLGHYLKWISLRTAQEPFNQTPSLPPSPILTDITSKSVSKEGSGGERVSKEAQSGNRMATSNGTQRVPETAKGEGEQCAKQK